MIAPTAIPAMVFCDRPAEEFVDVGGEEAVPVAPAVTVATIVVLVGVCDTVNTKLVLNDVKEDDVELPVEDGLWVLEASTAVQGLSSGESVAEGKRVEQDCCAVALFASNTMQFW
jgi:hypothetical protein